MFGDITNGVLGCIQCWSRSWCSPSQRGKTFENNSVHTYNAFYRVQFGDANEWKVWGGASHEGQGYVGSILRAPMTRSLALEGTFAYLMPGESKSVTDCTNN